ALLIVLLINVFLRKRKTSQSVRQPNPSHIKQNTDPSRFKASDLETSDESTEETDLKQTHSDETETESTYEQETTQNSETEETKQPAQGDSVMYRFGKGATRNKVLAAMLFGMFIAILNQTLLNVALPKINSDFNITASTGQWLMTGFMLVNGILIPVSAFLFDRFSYRKLYLFSLVIFTLGSLVCGIAMNFPVMMTGRVLQAAGAGILMPLGSNVIMTIFPPAKRGMAMG
ncbi:MFS transporter, partial [Burkholderia multivorans]